MGRLTISITNALKGDAESTYRSLGMNLTTAIKLFLKQSVRDGGLPFKPNLNRKANKEREDNADQQASMIIHLILNKAHSISTDPKVKLSTTQLAYILQDVNDPIRKLYTGTMPYQYRLVVDEAISDYKDGESFKEARPVTWSTAIRLCYEFLAGFTITKHTPYQIYFGSDLTKAEKHNAKSKQSHKHFNTHGLYTLGTSKDGQNNYVKLTGLVLRNKLIQLINNVSK